MKAKRNNYFRLVESLRLEDPGIAPRASRSASCLFIRYLMQLHRDSARNPRCPLWFLGVNYRSCRRISEPAIGTRGSASETQ